MKKVKLYIATSLDGFIADKNGSVNWLENFPNPNLLDYGYNDFYDSIDTTLMGNATYQQILNFDIPFPYAGKQNIVFTRNNTLEKDDNVRFITKDIPNFVRTLKQELGKDIWLIGGGQINILLFNHGLIDEIIITYIPIVLGEGIPFFGGIANQTTLKLLKTKTFSTGAISMIYGVD